MIKAKKKLCKTCSVLFFSNGNYCKSCIIKKKKEQQKMKVKKERADIKKENLCTEKKLDSIFSKLVRTIYPPICHSSNQPITYNTCHACHLIGRAAFSVRFDLRNVMPCKPEENLFNQLHVIGLAKKLTEYYGIDVDDFLAASRQCTPKFTNAERKEMYKIFSEGLKIAENLKHEEDFHELRLKIISLTKQIL